MPTDVTVYADNLALFKAAYDKYGRVDHAIACAGILEEGRWFDEELTIDTVAEEPPTIVLDVNLKAVLFFARIAIVYMADGKTRDRDRSLTMLSSAAGFRPSPGLPVYQVSMQPERCFSIMLIVTTVDKAWRDGNTEIITGSHTAAEWHPNQQRAFH